MASGIATRELLSLKDPPTCIMYPDNFSYIGGMNEIEKWAFHSGRHKRNGI
jgi:LacI family transcriptional regulator